MHFFWIHTRISSLQNVIVQYIHYSPEIYLGLYTIVDKCRDIKTFLKTNNLKDE